MSSAPPPRPAFVPKRSRDRKRLAELRQAWGQPIARHRPAETIALYHQSVAADKTVVDDATWGDLGLGDVFATLDRTQGMPGRQLLYHQLRTYESDPAVLAERSRQHDLFRRDAELRERIQLQTLRLDGAGSAYMAPLLLGQLPQPPRAAAWILLLSVLTPACLIGMFFVHALFLPALLFCFINVLIYASYGQKIQPLFTGFSQIVTLLGAAEELGSTPDAHQLPQLAKLRDSSRLIKTVRGQLGWLAMDRAALPELTQAVFGYLNILCLLDTVVFLRALRALERNRATLVEVFTAIGSLDAAISIASYLESVPSSTTPMFSTGRAVKLRGFYHPLIPDAVANDLTLSGQSILVAGPNMAGKTAFVRTVGLNVLFAQTFHFCLATEVVIPRAVVRSAIRREDVLVEGRSYFFTEIKQLLDFARTGADQPLHLFLVDEIFRGTNTVERIASSAAVLRHLAQHHLVLATTHDFELQEMLRDTYAMYHFSDRVVDGKYGFDYRIHPGPVRSRNAIKLLELSGYPPAITAEATRLAAELESGLPAGHSLAPQ